MFEIKHVQKRIAVMQILVIRIIIIIMLRLIQFTSIFLMKTTYLLW